MYQTLSATRRRPIKVPGFDSLEATEIPQLIDHAKRLATQRRMESDAVFLNSLLQALISLHIWTQTSHNEKRLTAREGQVQIEVVRGALRTLEKVRDVSGFPNSWALTTLSRLTYLLQRVTVLIDILLTTCRRLLTITVPTRMKSSVTTAVNEAPSIALRWPKQITNPQGLPFQSYSAACRRQ
jgi:hypothetical protein